MPQTREARAQREWTLMFYFASDNPLAPGIVSHLKALKQAGFHPEANVVVHFDPNAPDEPVHIFDVNLVNKLRAGGRARIGFPPNPPAVRNLAEDKLWGREKKALIREALREELGDGCAAYDPPPTHAKMSGEQSPRDGLRTFLDFCRKHYPARRYMLFILGHGLVMGQNMFLLDEHAPEPTMTLRDLGAVLRRFRRGLDAEGSRLELVSFHCCSMSGLEVAYELQGTANYMLASQGPAFVGSWPYGPILVSVLNSIRKLAAGGDGAGVVKALVKEIWSHCYLNSYDFQLVGYSFDLCLCDLNKVREIKGPLRELSLELAEGLADPLARERILLAHWDAQSFWEDSYTDLYDFCFRLRERCGDVLAASERSAARLRSIREKCEAVMRALASGDEQLVIRAEFTGPAYQFSHGLFVYFPWAEPGDGYFWFEEYGNYKFKETAWREFLQRYFRDTMRQARGSERHPSEGLGVRFGLDEVLLENIPGRDFQRDAQQLGRGGPMSAKQAKSKKKTGVAVRTGVRAGDGTPPPAKSGPRDPLGDGRGGSSVKNYPPAVRASAVKGGANREGGVKEVRGVPARTGVRAGNSGSSKPGPSDPTGDGRATSSVKNYPPVASGAKREEGKKEARGVSARTGVRPGGKPTGGAGAGDDFSSVKNYPSSARLSVGGLGAKQSGGKKEARGAKARTGLRAGPSPADGKPDPAMGDGPGGSSVKNYPSSAGGSLSKGGAKTGGNKKDARGVAARTGIKAGPAPGKGGADDRTGDGFGSSPVKNHPPSARGPVASGGAEREGNKRQSRGLAARTGVRAGSGPGKSGSDVGDGRGGSSVKNYPPVALGPVGESGAKREGNKKEVRGLVARTGIRAGQGDVRKLSPRDPTGDGFGSSSVKNHPSDARVTAGRSGAKAQGRKKNAAGVPARTGIRAGGKGGGSDATGDAFGPSTIKNYPTAARGSVIESGTKQKGGRKEARGIATRTGIRAGGGKGGINDPTGDGFGLSSAKNHPPSTRRSARRK
jgi:hypothetical protein